jgi:hypothetical protein
VVRYIGYDDLMPKRLGHVSEIDGGLIYLTITSTKQFYSGLAIVLFVTMDVVTRKLFSPRKSVGMCGG